MVSARVLSDLSKFDKYCTRTETLSEWINTVRYKKGVIRKQRKNRDLRVAAVLTTAIRRAEMELRRKQTERAQRWAQVRAQYEGEEWNVRETFDEVSHNNNNNNDCNQHHHKEEKEQSDDELLEEEVAKLWSSELMGLDNLFNDLNQIKTAVAR